MRAFTFLVALLLSASVVSGQTVSVTSNGENVATETTLNNAAADISTMADDINYIRTNLGTDAGLAGAFVTKGPNLFCAYDDTSPSAATEDTNQRTRCNQYGALYFAIADATNDRRATVTAANELLVELGAGTASVGEVTGVNDLPIIACNQVYTGAPSADGDLIALSGSTVIYICSMHIDAEGTVDTRILSGTGTACGTSTTQMSPLYQFSTTTGVLGTNEGSGLGMIMKSDAGENVCIDVSGAVVNNVRITYAQF